MDKIKFNFISVTPDNVTEYGVFCIKEKNTPGSQAKINWCKCKGNEGVQIKIAVNGQNKQVGFIEFIPAESAWRPVKADNYLFIHCIAVFVKDARNKNLGSLLIKSCEEEAHKLNKAGVCIMTSNGRWMADKALFVKNGYEKVDERGRYELMVKKFKPGSQLPALIDWEVQQKKFKGWNLLYADQCP